MSCLFKCWLPVCVMDHHTGFIQFGSVCALLVHPEAVEQVLHKKWLLAGKDIFCVLLDFQAFMY